MSESPHKTLETMFTAVLGGMGLDAELMVTDVDAGEMVRGIRGYALLAGVRGAAPADVKGLEEIIRRVSQLVGEQETIEEMDINPLAAFPDRVIALDARFRIADGS